MPWTMNDYPQAWRHLDELGRREVIDIADAVLGDGCKEGDAIPVATKQAEEWYKDVGKEELEELKHKRITQHQKNPSVRPGLNDEDVHVYYEDHGWKVKTEDAKQTSDTFSTKREAEQHTKEITDNHGIQVIEHQKDG